MEEQPRKSGKSHICAGARHTESQAPDVIFIPDRRPERALGLQHYLPLSREAEDALNTCVPPREGDPELASLSLPSLLR